MHVCLHLISLAYFYLCYTIEVVQGHAIIANKMLTRGTETTFLIVVFLIIAVVPGLFRINKGSNICFQLRIYSELAIINGPL